MTILNQSQAKKLTEAHFYDKYLMFLLVLYKCDRRSYLNRLIRKEAHHET
jgi:hypothetical protein